MVQLPAINKGKDGSTSGYSGKEEGREGGMVQLPVIHGRSNDLTDGYKGRERFFSTRLS